MCEACDLKKYIQKALAAGVVSVRWFHFNRQRVGGRAWVLHEPRSICALVMGLRQAVLHLSLPQCTLKPCKDIYGANCAKCGPRQCTECIKQPIRPVLKLPVRMSWLLRQGGALGRSCPAGLAGIPSLTASTPAGATHFAVLPGSVPACDG